jgi:hypothetical protein
MGLSHYFPGFLLELGHIFRATWKDYVRLPDFPNFSVSLSYLIFGEHINYSHRDPLPMQICPHVCPEWAGAYRSLIIAKV